MSRTDAPPAAPLTMTADELAAALRVDRATVFRWDAAGRLPQGLKIGGCKRWRRDEIVAWLRAGCPVRSRWEWPPEGGRP